MIAPSVSAANVLGGGIARPRALLLGPINLCPEPDTEVSIGGWTTSNGAVASRVWDETNVFGRYALNVSGDDQGGDPNPAGRADLVAETNRPLIGQTLLFTAWVRPDSDGVMSFGLVADDGSNAESFSTADIVRVPDSWTFVRLEATFAAVTDSDVTIRVRPNVGDDATRSLNLVRPRLHRVVGELLDALPEWHLREFRFPPRMAAASRRGADGKLTTHQKGHLVEIDHELPYLSKTELSAVSALYGHTGPILYQPYSDAALALYVSTAEEAWDFDHLAKRAIGHTGTYTLQGEEAIPGIPDTTQYLDTENRTFVAVHRWF